MRMRDGPMAVATLLGEWVNNRILGCVFLGGSLAAWDSFVNCQR